MPDIQAQPSSEQLFKQLTTAVCQHLKPEDSLSAAFNILRQHIPADYMFLESYEHQLGSIRVLARANSFEGGVAMDLLVPLQVSLEQHIKNIQSDKQQNEALVINDPETNPIARSVIEAFSDHYNYSVMVLNPQLSDLTVGSIVLIAEGKHRFNDLHLEIFKLLSDPYAIAISNVVKHRELIKVQELLADDNRFLQQQINSEAGATIIGSEFGLASTMEAANKAAQHDTTVLLLGETGVGKDVIANHIQQMSQRSEQPFIRVNCGAIAESLMDSELFGHKKGAFTGAINDKRGLFERANGGTIFLDEIGELTLAAQVRLLRVLQNKEIEPVGSDQVLPIDVRVIAATHRDLDKMISEGEFRQDLLFRINTFPITVPPLRQRLYDIPALVEYLVHKKTRLLKLGKPPMLSQALVKQLMDYDWPGNIRELENVLERELILNNEEVLSLQEFHKNQQTNSLETQPEQLQNHAWPLDQMTKQHIHAALEHCQGKIHGNDGAAQLLEVNASTLRSKIKKLNINY